MTFSRDGWIKKWRLTVRKTVIKDRTVSRLMTAEYEQPKRRHDLLKHFCLKIFRLDLPIVYLSKTYVQLFKIRFCEDQ